MVDANLFLQNGLIHGLYRPAGQILSAFKSRCRDKGIDFSRLSWVGSAVPPDVNHQDPEVALVLHVALGSPLETLYFSWDWAVDEQRNGDVDRWDGLDMDAEDMHRFERSAIQPINQIQWICLKLDAFVGVRPSSNIQPEMYAPGCSPILLFAQHPARLFAMDFRKRFGLWIPALRSDYIGQTADYHVPYVYFQRETGRIRLRSASHTRSHDYLSIPVIREQLDAS